MPLEVDDLRVVGPKDSISSAAEATQLGKLCPCNILTSHPLEHILLVQECLFGISESRFWVRLVVVGDGTIADLLSGSFSIVTEFVSMQNDEFFYPNMAGPALLVNSRSLFNVAQLGSPWPVQQSKIPEGAWEHNFYLMPKLYFKLLEFRCSVAFWRAGHMSCPEVVVGLMWWGRHWVNIAASWEHKICLSEVSSVFPHSTVLNESADGSKYRPR